MHTLESLHISHEHWSILPDLCTTECHNVHAMSCFLLELCYAFPRPVVSKCFLITHPISKSILSIYLQLVSLIIIYTDVLMY